LKALLDTYTFLWWIGDDRQLPQSTRDVISDGDNELYFSAASCWEIAIKAGLGRISLPERPEIFVADQLAANGIIGLPVQPAHALHVFSLPSHHRDPFDRMLVSQAQLEDMPIITSDSLIAQYDVKVIWGR
jgi:PIN domain nuclease of toxin-antitoxin system